MGSLGWLVFWQKEGHETMSNVQEITTRNWDRLAEKYLEPDTLGAMLRQNGFDPLPGLKRYCPGTGYDKTPLVG